MGRTYRGERKLNKKQRSKLKEFRQKRQNKGVFDMDFKKTNNKDYRELNDDEY